MRPAKNKAAEAAEAAEKLGLDSGFGRVGRA